MPKGERVSIESKLVEILEQVQDEELLPDLTATVNWVLREWIKQHWLSKQDVPTAIPTPSSPIPSSIMAIAPPPALVSLPTSVPSPDTDHVLDSLLRDMCA